MRVFDISELFGCSDSTRQQCPHIRTGTLCDCHSTSIAWAWRLRTPQLLVRFPIWRKGGLGLVSGQPLQRRHYRRLKSPQRHWSTVETKGSELAARATSKEIVVRSFQY